MTLLSLVLGAAMSFSAGDVVVRPQGVYTQPAQPAQDSLNADLDLALQKAAKQLETTNTSTITPTEVTSNSVSSESQPLVAEKVKTEDTTPLQITAKTDSAVSSTYTRMVLGLGVFVLIAGAALFGVRRWSHGRPVSRNKARIEVVSQYSLGAKRSLLIVHIAGESLLLGVTENNIALIKNLALIDDEVPEQIPSSFNRAMREVDARHETPDEFAAGQLKDLRTLVSGKLKGLRTLA